MATIAQPAGRTYERPAILDWLTTVDHKKLGIMYLYTTFTMFFVAGCFALVFRTQLAEANNTLITHDTFNELVSRGAHAGDVATRALAASRNAALEAAERVTRNEGARQTANALHAARASVGVLAADELPIANYDELNVNEAVAEIKDLANPSDVRTIIAYEEANKNRQRVVSAAQTRVAAIAQEVVGIN